MALVSEETKIVTIDDAPRSVEDLPEQAKQLIKFYDDWKQKEMDARSDLLLAQTGMRTLANEIAMIVKKADEEAATAAAEAAAAEATTEAVEAEVTEAE